MPLIRWLEKHRRRRLPARGASDLLPWLQAGVCADCGNDVFAPGPTGGIAHNIACLDCGSAFNVAGAFGTPIHAERIGNPHPYRDADSAPRDCDHCGHVYRGPAVYCSLRCAMADA